MLSAAVSSCSPTVKRSRRTPRSSRVPPWASRATGKRVTILVIDGRRDSYSVGASYAIMSKMFRAFDIWEAINLDGGGSSTFAVRKSETFETRNRPTDTAGDREVVNGLAIVKSKN